MASASADFCDRLRSVSCSQSCRLASNGFPVRVESHQPARRFRRVGPRSHSAAIPWLARPQLRPDPGLLGLERQVEERHHPRQPRRTREDDYRLGTGRQDSRLWIAAPRRLQQSVREFGEGDRSSRPALPRRQIFDRGRQDRMGQPEVG